jgi:hypothetical protein
MSGCTEDSGFLFSHPCRAAATAACQKCRKGVCAQHIHPTPHGYMCTTCAKKSARSAKRQGQSWGATAHPLLYDTFYYDDYGYYGRGHWGHDQLDHDFTEADGASFGDEAEGDWEHDMGAS